MHGERQLQNGTNLDGRRGIGGDERRDANTHDHGDLDKSWLKSSEEARGTLQLT
jgi:hypothetical protein